MASEASSTQVVKPTGQTAGEGSAAAPNADLGEGRESEEERGWRPVLGLPCELTVELPLPGVKIADFLKLRVGSVISTDWRLERDVPLRLNGTLIGWSEFDVVGNSLAVRLTELV